MVIDGNSISQKNFVRIFPLRTFLYNEEWYLNLTRIICIFDLTIGYNVPYSWHIIWMGWHVVALRIRVIVLGGILNWLMAFKLMAVWRGMYFGYLIIIYERMEVRGHDLGLFNSRRGDFIFIFYFSFYAWGLFYLF